MRTTQPNRKRPPIWATLGTLILAGVIAWFRYSHKVVPEARPPRATVPDAGSIPRVVDSTSLQHAIATKAKDVAVEGSGKVVKLLPDDTEGDRHQRLLLDVSAQQTVLIAHNIDVGKRIAVREGATVSFKGEYVWNDRGGVVHWTHHDPRGKHPDGWVKVGEKTFD